MILCIDIGNTNIKYGIFKDNKLVAHLIYQNIEVTDFVARFTNITQNISSLTNLLFI